jgi:hypothetical protein
MWENLHNKSAKYRTRKLYEVANRCAGICGKAGVAIGSMRAVSTLIPRPRQRCGQTHTPNHQNAPKYRTRKTLCVCNRYAVLRWLPITRQSRSMRVLSTLIPRPRQRCGQTYTQKSPNSTHRRIDEIAILLQMRIAKTANC